MSKELELWKFAASRLNTGEDVMLLVVAASSGSSPGRAGYKMAVAADGQLCGSVGGGVMEVNLVEHAKTVLSVPGAVATGDLTKATVTDLVHQKNSPHSSGMICSGKQTIIIKRLTATDTGTVSSIACGRHDQNPAALEISNLRFQIVENTIENSRRYFSRTSDLEFIYQEKLGTATELFIIGGGHCSLALSEFMAKLDFRISIFDDRPELNTLAKNQFADEITTISAYDAIAHHLPAGDEIYVVVMTLGYKSDEVVIRALSDRDFKYFGVLGSKAKMKTLLKALESEGFSKERLARIRTPIGLPINSRTPEEIAVSIAAEIIAVKNGAEPPA